jgi:hypothetical protein
MLAAIGTAKDNRYYVADEALQKVYEKQMGKSLENAIDDLLLSEKRDSGFAGNVIIQLNGGGRKNQIYIGQQNRLELLISNSDTLGGFALGFSLDCEPCKFEFVENYGTITPVKSDRENVVRLHTDAFPDTIDSYPIVELSENQDSIMFGLIAGDSPIPPHSSPALIFSANIHVSDSTPEMLNGFSINNVFYDGRNTDHLWQFHRRGVGNISFTPDFMGNPGDSLGSAPAVKFDIVKAVMTDSIEPESDKPTASDPDSIIHAKLLFESNLTDMGLLKDLLIDYQDHGDYLLISFKIELLPQLCQLKGVKKLVL